MNNKQIDIDIHTISKVDLQKYELIDIRESDEITQWPPIKECQQIPFSEFPHNINEFDKSKNYLIFCAKGGRSHMMAEVLNSQGINALSVNNGIASVNSYLKNI